MEIKNSSQKKRKRVKGILFRTTIFTWLIIIFIISLFTITINPFQKQSLIKSIESKAEAIATSIDQVTVNSIIMKDYSTVVEHCLMVVQERKSIYYIVITPKEGKSLVHTANGWGEKDLHGIWKSQKLDVNKGSFTNSPLVDKEVYHYTHLLQYSGIEWGWIHVGLSLDQFNKDLTAIYSRTMLLAVFSIFLGFFISFIYARKLSKPILQLNEITKQIANGDLAVRIKIKSGDEVEDLAESFNQMAESLQKTQDDLLAAKDQLEKRVEERTKELSKTNEQLKKENNERLHAEEALRLSEVQFRSVVENAPVGIYRTTPNGKILMANPALIKMLGYSSFEDLKKRNVSDKSFYLNYPREKFISSLERRGEIRSFETEWCRKNGVTIDVRENARIEYNELGKPLYFEGTVEDITESKKNQEKLQLSDKILSSVGSLVLVSDVHGDIRYVGPSVQKILGFTPNEVLGDQWFKRTRKEINDISDIKNHMSNAAKNNNFIKEEHETKILDKDGNEHWILWYNTKGPEDTLIGIGSDITERKKITDQIEQSLKEKVILLKEIHHRVKNNLQIISSLLYLQSKKIDDTRSLELFKDSQSRVKSMALIHEKLYQSDDLAMINFSEYIKNLTKYILQTYGTSEKIVFLDVKVDDVSLDLDTAIPCGLIINELVSNSFKYAFQNKNGNGAKNIIQVHLVKQNGNYLLNVKDNGKGLPDDINFESLNSLGLQLVQNLTNQLSGEIDIKSGNGTEFLIRFGKDKHCRNEDGI